MDSRRITGDLRGGWSMQSNEPWTIRTHDQQDGVSSQETLRMRCIKLNVKATQGNSWKRRMKEALWDRNGQLISNSKDGSCGLLQLTSIEPMWRRTVPRLRSYFFFNSQQIESCYIKQWCNDCIAGWWSDALHPLTNTLLPVQYADLARQLAVDWLHQCLELIAISAE